MKKIIFITEDLVDMGGVVRVITNWSNYFINKGYEVENVCVYDGKPYFDLDKRVRFTIENFKFRYKLWKLIDIIPNTIKMYKFLNKRRNSNIIFNKSLYIEPIWILRKLGLFKDINLIYFAHGGSSDFRNFYLNRKGVAHRLSMIFKAFDKVVCLYDDETNYPILVDKSKLHFISNTVTFNKSDISFEEKENIVLSLGRVTKDKGIDTLIYAWDKIKNKVDDWILKIVGDGEDKADFEQLVNSLNIPNIQFIDGTTNVKPFYEEAKIFVIPSLFEGMPMTILEAMACKCCVISSKTAGGLKLVSDNGLLFDIGDSNKLADIILSTVRDNSLRERLAKKSYNYVDNYDINNVADGWNEIL